MADLQDRRLADLQSFKKGDDDTGDAEEEGEEEEEEESKAELPRLFADLGSMVRWIERSEGMVDTEVREGGEGWTLHANRFVAKGTTLMSIPKSLCIFSDPQVMVENPLLDNARLLMQSLDRKHWRARLAVALLSERVRPSSFFRSYLRNLPFEFWGMPVFFSADEFGLMQDLSLMQKTRDRCKFLGEFAESVLLPLQKSPQDPFSGNSADVNAFGWGFASASSRALRSHQVVGPEGGAVMIPGIDLASHSLKPNCQVVDEGSFFSLITTQGVEFGGELTIDYGAMSNEELLSDFGFTVDNNPNEKVSVSCDAFLFNTARVVMGQSSPLDDRAGGGNNRALADLPLQSSNAALTKLFGSKFEAFNSSAPSPAAAAKVSVGAEDRFDDRSLHGWQRVWLRVLGLYGPGATFGMTLGCPSAAQVDPRLFAMLRVLYAQSEEDLSRHGYDPFLLQNMGSMLAPRLEAQVIKTLVGIVAIVFRSYGTDVEKDLFMLRSELTEDPDEVSLGGRDGSYAMVGNSDDVVADAHRILRNIFRIPHPPPPSPTVRRQQQNAIRSPGPGVASASSSSSSSSSSRPAVASALDDSVETVLSDAASVEDMIRGSSSSSSFPTVGTFSAPGQASSHADQERLDSKQQASSGAPTSNAADSAADLNDLGLGLPVNVREALRYRIRRKRALAGLIVNLGELYQVSDQALPRLLVLSPPSPSPSDLMTPTHTHTQTMPPHTEAERARPQHRGSTSRGC